MNPENGEDARTCRCPYCETEVEGKPPFCMTCEVMIMKCEGCGGPVRKGAETCPTCGKSLSWT
jgi:hypothetical protein